MKKSLLLVSLLSLFGTFSVYSQKNLNSEPGLTLEPSSEKKETKDLLKELEGSFQFQISKDDHKVMLYPDLANFIESSRKEEEDVFITLDEYVTLYIPSIKKIGSTDFVSLPMFYYTFK